MRSPVALTTRFGFAMLMALGASVAEAQDPEAEPHPPHQRGVHLRVMVVQAFEQVQGPSDPECAALPRQLGPLQFGTLRLIAQSQQRALMGEDVRVTLPTGEVRMMPVSVVHQRLHMYLNWPGQVNSNVRMQRGKPIVVGGPRHNGGHLLVYIEPDF
jgi:hypothetical protein